LYHSEKSTARAVNFSSAIFPLVIITVRANALAMTD
jgi:hypothetical protein